jgi:glycosyltransferase involved in cell wall biosynthesis
VNIKKGNKPVILYLMRFESLKEGSFERFLSYIGKSLQNDFQLVFIFQSKPSSKLVNKIKRHGVIVDWMDFTVAPKTFMQLYKIIRKHNPQIIHLHFFGLLTPFVPFIKWCFRKRLIVHIHSVESYNSANNIVLEWLIPIRKILFAKSIDKGITVSKFVKNETLSVFPLADQKLMYMYNGIEAENHDEFFYKKYDYTNKNIILASVAWLNENKGIDVLIQSIPLVVDKISENLKLLIIGDGPQKKSLMEYADSLNVRSYIEFLGWRNDVPEILKTCHIFVAPSVCKDAFPYVVLEGMSSGAAIIGSNIGGIPEMMGESCEAGELVEPGNANDIANAIIGLATNAEKRKKCATDALEIAKNKFSIEKQIVMLKQLYGSIL